MPAVAGWLALGVLLLYTAIELWSRVLPDDTETDSAASEEPRLARQMSESAAGSILQVRKLKSAS